MSSETPQDRHGDNLYPSRLEARFGDHALELDVPAGVWNPTPHGMHLGHMLLELDFDGEHVLELGTGCGIHAILLGRRGVSKLTLTEIEAPILDNARHNLRKHEVDVPIDTHVADWTHVPGGPYDTVVTNPPFAKSGKRYRRYFLDTLILDAHKLLRPGGRLVFVQSSMANVARTMALFDDCGMQVEVVGETSGPFRDYYFEDPSFLREMRTFPGAYDLRDGTYYERLTVFSARVP